MKSGRNYLGKSRRGSLPGQGSIMCKGSEAVGGVRRLKNQQDHLGNSEYEQEGWSVVFPAGF